MAKKVFLVVEGEELFAHNKMAEALERYETLQDFILGDGSLLTISFNAETKKLEPEQVELKEIATYYKEKEKEN